MMLFLYHMYVLKYLLQIYVSSFHFLYIIFSLPIVLTFYVIEFINFFLYSVLGVEERVSLI